MTQIQKIKKEMMSLRKKEKKKLLMMAKARIMFLTITQQTILEKRKILSMILIRPRMSRIN